MRVYRAMLLANTLDERAGDEGAADCGTVEEAASGTCRPHSRVWSFSHHQRPARSGSPGLMARVQGSQPIEG